MSQRLQFVERFGLHMAEEHTMPHMCGRVLGSLLLTMDPMRSIDELTEELKASRGAISMAIKDLTRLGLVEKVNRAGDRKFYYRLRPDLWSKLYLERLDNIEEHVRLAEEGLRVMANAPREKKERLLEMGAFFRFLLEKLPQAALEWKQRAPELMGTLERETTNS
jgi:DNA-binding transcriptional regulator GbsR (MarR family)